MPKMDDETLLEQLQRYEDESSQYTFGALRTSRERAYKDYFQQPYGNEEEGWSQLVTSDVQDTVEWILPALLDKFFNTEKTVEFEPSRQSDAKGAEQATDACNYIFHKQNNGFLILYTAFKDALMVKNAAIHWYRESTTVVEKMPLRGVSEMQIRLAERDGWERPADVEEVGAQPIVDPNTGLPALNADGSPMMGEKLFNARMTKQVEQQKIKIDAFEPENLQISRYWTSPLLEDCPYVARQMPVSLSDLKQMGFDVDAEDLAASAQPVGGEVDMQARRDRQDQQGIMYLDDRNEMDNEDESQTTGWLRIEWVLADRDGDGIAERLEVYRLADKILSVEECSQVPIATGSPILVQHQWDGMSVAETVADLQKLRTEIMRQVVNNAYLANNPRTTVLTDVNGAPKANIDDLLDGRPGSILRHSVADAIGTQGTPFVGAQMFGMMEYIDHMREQRTGVSKNQQGLDPNALRNDRTAQEVVLTANAAQQRINLIARIFSETMVKPIFRGILRLLTEGDMQPLAFRLRGEFVEMDPNEWRDSYDMTVNVGLGTGDAEKQLAILNNTFQTQMALAQSPLGPMMVKPEQIYNTRSKMLDLGGFKNVGDYFSNPGPEAKIPTPPPPAPPYQVAIKQMDLQADSQKFAAEVQRDMQMAQIEDARKQRELEWQNTIQQANDERDFAARQWEAQSKERIALAEIEAKRQSDLERNRTAIITARIAHPETQLTDMDIDPVTGQVFQKIDPMPELLAGVAAIAQQQTAPKLVIRDQNGRVAGVQQGDVVQQVVRGPDGAVVGLQ